MKLATVSSRRVRALGLFESTVFKLLFELNINASMHVKQVFDTKNPVTTLVQTTSQ